jgi:hypothetical protein
LQVFRVCSGGEQAFDVGTPALALRLGAESSSGRMTGLEENRLSGGDKRSLEQFKGRVSKEGFGLLSKDGC